MQKAQRAARATETRKHSQSQAQKQKATLHTYTYKAPGKHSTLDTYEPTHVKHQEDTLHLQSTKKKHPGKSLKSTKAQATTPNQSKETPGKAKQTKA